MNVDGDNMEYIKINNKTKKKLQEVQLEILEEVVRICEKHNIQYFLMAGTLLGAVRHKGFIPWDDDLDIGMTRLDYNKFNKVASKELNSRYYLHNHKTDPEYWCPFTKVRKNNTEMNEKILVDVNTHKGIYIDIFPFDNADSRNGFFVKIQGKMSLVITYIIWCKLKGEKVSLFSRKFIKALLMLIPNNILIKIQNWVVSLNKNDNSKYLISFSGVYGYEKESFTRNKLFPLKKVEFEKKLYYGFHDNSYYLTRMYDDYMRLPPVEERTNHMALNISFSKGVNKKNKDILL